MGVACAEKVVKPPLWHPEAEQFWFAGEVVTWVEGFTTTPR